MKEGKSSKEALDELKLRKFCCRGMLISNVEVINEVAKYKKY